MSAHHHPNEINRDYIRLLQGMSRFIREEFTVSIRMTQEDAVEQLLHYAAQSTNRVLQEMAKELKEFTYGDESATSAEHGQPSSEEGIRYYRGVPVIETHKPQRAATPPAEVKKRPTRVYRGQVVQG